MKTKLSMFYCIHSRSHLLLLKHMFRVELCFGTVESPHVVVSIDERLFFPLSSFFSRFHMNFVFISTTQIFNFYLSPIGSASFFVDLRIRVVEIETFIDCGEEIENQLVCDRNRIESEHLEQARNRRLKEIF